jgi:hypothetical protein
MSENTSLVSQNGQMEHAMSVENVMAQVHAIQDLMRQAMIRDEHYGVIPGCVKPSLLKPGAEKLGMMFRLSPAYTITRREHGNGHLEFEVMCRLTHIKTLEIWGEGVGSCSTLETKFRYRKAEQTCPKCGKPTIIKGKKEYGGGWLCYAKKGGCGAKFNDGDKEIENQNMGRIEHDNPADYYNTCLKMAKKRAQVDAILTATAASDIFTQDVEEMVDNGVITITETPSAKASIPTPPLKTKPTIKERIENDDPGPAEPPMSDPATDSEPPDGVGAELDIFAELDNKIDAYCNGDKGKKTEVYKTLTKFKGSDGVDRSAWSIEQLKGWKNSEKLAKATMSKFDERKQMGTKYKFEQ